MRSDKLLALAVKTWQQHVVDEWGPVKSPERRKAAADHKAVCRVLARKRAAATAAAARMAAAEPEAERGLGATGPTTTARLAARTQGSRQRKAGAAGPAGRQVCLATGSVPGECCMHVRAGKTTDACYPCSSLHPRVRTLQNYV